MGRTGHSIRFGALVVGPLCILLPMVSLAGTQSGFVVIDHGTYASSPTSPGYAFFHLQGGSAKASSPACNTVIGRWVINLSWPAAKYQYAVLLAAITSGKTVSVIGTGDCAVWSDTETAMDIRLNNN
jgi:hypothetical protein